MTITAKRGMAWPLAGLLVLTLVTRGSVLWAMRGNLEQDPDAYREIAENLLRHGEFALGSGDPNAPKSDYRPTAYRPPLYPLVLSNLPTADGQTLSLIQVAGVHLLLGLATVWLTWLTARRFLAMWAVPTGVVPVDEVGPHRPTGATKTIAPYVASLLIALDPILLNQQTLVMTETLATFLAVLCLWCLARLHDAPTWFNAALAGGAIGLAILCRPTFLPWLGLVAFAMVLVRSRLPSRLASRASNAVALGLAAIAILSPWAIRNYRVFGKPIATTTHGGYTLLLGNNASFYDWLRADQSDLPWDGGDLLARDLSLLARMNRVLSLNRAAMVVVPQDELEMDSMSYDIAYRTIRERPMDFVRACAYRAGQLWSPLPHRLTTDESTARRLLRYAVCAWYLAVYALAAKRR